MEGRNVNPRPDYPRPPAPPAPPPPPGAHSGWTQADRDRSIRIERKLDTLIAALAADEEIDHPVEDLEGQQFGGERDQTQSLD